MNISNGFCPKCPRIPRIIIDNNTRVCVIIMILLRLVNIII